MMKKMCVEKMLSQLTGDMYEFYQWLKSKCSGVDGVDVTYGKTHWNGSEDVCMAFQLKYHWENELDKRKDPGIHKIISIMEYIAKKFNWDIDIKWFNLYRSATDEVLIIKIVNRKENLTTEVKSKMKKLNITKEAFEKSKYFKNKYGELEYVSESGKVFKTDKGKILMFVKESSERMSYEDLLMKFEEIQDKIGEDAALDTEVYFTYDPLDEETQEYIDKKGYTPFITWYSLQSAYGNNICWPSGAYEGSKHSKHMSASTVWELCRFFKKNLKKFSGYKVIGAFSGYDKIKDIKHENGRVVVVFGKSNENDDVNESTKKFGKKFFSKEGTESNPRFKCMEGYNPEYDDDILEFREDVINALKKCYDDKYLVEPDIYGKTINVTYPDIGIDFQLAISAHDDVEM